MTPVLYLTQVQERLTVTVWCVNQASESVVSIVIDGKAYSGLFIVPSIFAYTLALERGPHIIYAQATDSAGTVTTEPITYVMSYELTDYGIDVYSGDAKLDAIEPLLHDALLPDLPTLNFSCATLLTGNIEVVIRERGLKQYQFIVDTVGKSGALYQYTCVAAESYALTTALMVLQTAYGSTADAIRLLVPSLNIVNAERLTQTTYPQLFGKITPLEVINQFLIQALAQASVRNGNLYAFPLDVAGKKVTFSADIKSAVAGNVQFYALGKYEINIGDRLSCVTTTTYQRFTMTGFFTHNPQGYNGDVCSLSFYGGYGSGVIPTVRNVEILVDGVQVLVSATEFTGSPSEYCMKDITAIAQQNMIPLWYRDPDYHMQRLDPLTGWQKDADVYDAVIAHYLVKQYPTPATVLTLNDALITGHWTSTGTPTSPLVTSPANVTQVLGNLLPVPSGALGMLYANKDATRVGLSVLFKDYDRIRFNWNPVTAAYVDISLQQDGANKLDLRHYFAGQSGAGFILNTGTASTDILYKDIALSPVQYVTTVTGTTTAGCSYRVKLLDAGGGTIWQDAWIHTIGNAFVANVLESVSQTYPATKVRIEFKDLYLIGTDYGVQAVTCTITGQTYNNVGSHEQIDSNVRYSVPMGVTRIDAVMTWTNVGSHQHVVSSTVYNLTYVWNPTVQAYLAGVTVPVATGSQWYTYIIGSVQWNVYSFYPQIYSPSDPSVGGDLSLSFFYGFDRGHLSGTITVTLNETVQDYAWVETSPSNDYTMETAICPVPSLTGIQIYTATVETAWMCSNQQNLDLGGDIFVSGGYLKWYEPFTADPPERIGNSWIAVNVVISETVQDYEWQPFTLVGDLAFFNLFESVDLVLSDFTRTGNPMNLATIALTFTGDNYVDSLVLIADNPLPVTVQAGTGSRAYVVTDDFGSQAGAQAYADGLLPIVSVAREQYTRDAPLSTDLGVGDTINGDGTNYTIYAVDYRQDGKTIAAGKSMDTLMTRLSEQSRRIDGLERKA